MKQTLIVKFSAVHAYYFLKEKWINPKYYGHLKWRQPENYFFTPRHPTSAIRLWNNAVMSKATRLYRCGESDSLQLWRQPGSSPGRVGHDCVTTDPQYPCRIWGSQRSIIPAEKQHEGPINYFFIFRQRRAVVFGLPIDKRWFQRCGPEAHEVALKVEREKIQVLSEIWQTDGGRSMGFKFMIKV